MNFRLGVWSFGGSGKRRSAALQTRPVYFGSPAWIWRKAAHGVAGALRRCIRTAIASGLLAAVCYSALVAAAGGESEGEASLTLPDATSSESTLLGFRDSAYALNPILRVHRRGVNEPTSLDYTWEVDNPASKNDEHIARVRVVGQEVSDDALRFKVEAQTDKSSYELCYCPLHETNRDCKSLERICRDVSVGITELSGVLYFVAPADAPRTVFHYFRDLARQRVELSVAEGDPKVYREVLIEAPKGNPDCSDYPEDDVDRYVCLYQGETMAPAPTPEQALLDALPDKLVQPKENYELIFAEEFEGNMGRRPAGDCEGGLSNLDIDKWNYSERWCRNVGVTNEPCETLRDGYYEMSYSEGCTSSIQTEGKFSYKYGYLETKYTINLDEAYQQNINMVIGDPWRSLKYAAKKYDVPLRNYEEISRYLPIEINLFEYFPERKRELANWFYNYHPYIYYPHTEPRYASTWTRFCDDAGQGVRQLNFFTVAQCQERDALTVTKGLEWTPRGYRILVQVKDLHDDFIVVSKESTPVQRRRARSSTTPTGFNSHVTRYTGTARDPFFEFLEPGDPESVLMQFAIAHSPLSVHFGAWGGFGDHETPGVERTTVRMKIDYVRVFQPRDRYADMEPVYE